MWKLHRYYLKETAINAILTFVVIFGLATVSLLYKALAIVKGGGVLDALIATLLMAVDILPHLLNSSLMFATVLTFTRASQDHEITAAKAVGIAPSVLMTPALLLGLICSLFATWALHYEIPWAHHERFRIIAELYKGEIDTMLRGQDHFEFSHGGIMTWQRKTRDHGQDVYHEASVFTRSKRASATLGISSGKGGVFFTTRRIWFVTDASGDLKMQCEDLYVPTTGYHLAKLTAGLDSQALSGNERREFDVKDLQSDALLAEVYRDAHPDPVFARYTIHRRTCFALMPFLLAPIAFCIGVIFQNRGRVAAMSFCMAPLGLVYLIDFLGESAVRKFALEWLGWSPSVFILVAGVPFCWRTLRT